MAQEVVLELVRVLVRVLVRAPEEAARVHQVPEFRMPETALESLSGRAARFCLP